MKHKKGESTQVTVLTIIGIILAVIGIIIITAAIWESIKTFAPSEKENKKRTALNAFNTIVNKMNKLSSQKSKLNDTIFAFKLPSDYRILIYGLRSYMGEDYNIKLLLQKKIENTKYPIYEKVTDKKLDGFVLASMNEVVVDDSAYHNLLLTSHELDPEKEYEKDEFITEIIGDDDSDFILSLCKIRTPSQKFIFLPSIKSITKDNSNKFDNKKCYLPLLNQKNYFIQPTIPKNKLIYSWQDLLTYLGVEDVRKTWVSGYGDVVGNVDGQSLKCVLDDKGIDYTKEKIMSITHLCSATKDGKAVVLNYNDDLSYLQSLYVMCTNFKGIWKKEINNVSITGDLLTLKNKDSDFCDVSKISNENKTSYKNIKSYLKKITLDSTKETSYADKIISQIKLIDEIRTNINVPRVRNYFIDFIVLNGVGEQKIVSKQLVGLFKTRKEFINYLESKENKEYFVGYSNKKISHFFDAFNFFPYNKSKIETQCNSMVKYFTGDDENRRKTCASNANLFNYCYFEDRNFLTSDECHACDKEIDCGNFKYKDTCEYSVDCLWVGENKCRWYEAEGDDPEGCYESKGLKDCSDIIQKTPCERAVCLDSVKCCYWKDNKCIKESAIGEKENERISKIKECRIDPDIYDNDSDIYKKLSVVLSEQRYIELVQDNEKTFEDSTENLIKKGILDKGVWQDFEAYKESVNNLISYYELECGRYDDDKDGCENYKNLWQFASDTNIKYPWNELIYRQISCKYIEN